MTKPITANSAANGLATLYNNTTPATPRTVANSSASFREMRPWTSTRFLVRSILMSMSRSMQLLNTQPEATTREVPIMAARNTARSTCPFEARKNPPATESTLPKMIPGLVIWIKCLSDIGSTSLRHHVRVDAEHDPQRPANQQHDHDGRKDESDHVVTLSDGTVQVQEVIQVNDHLDHCEQQNDCQRGGLRQARVHHQTERDDGQDHRQDEADGVRLYAAVASIMAVMGVCISHYRVPIR